MKKVCVKYCNGETEEFNTRLAAIQDILEKFAEDGVNPIEEVWEEDEAGNETPLAATWKITLEENE